MTPETIARSIAHELNTPQTRVIAHDSILSGSWDIYLVTETQRWILICRVGKRYLTLLYQDSTGSGRVDFEDPEMLDRIKTTLHNANSVYHPPAPT